MNSYHVLCEAFRRGDERTVMQLLQALPDLRHAHGEEPLHAACWYGMEDVARALVEIWAAEIGWELPLLAQMRGYTKLARWLEGIIKGMQSLIA